MHIAMLVLYMLLHIAMKSRGVPLWFPRLWRSVFRCWMLQALTASSPRASGCAMKILRPDISR